MFIFTTKRWSTTNAVKSMWAGSFLKKRTTKFSHCLKYPRLTIPLTLIACITTTPARRQFLSGKVSAFQSEGWVLDPQPLSESPQRSLGRVFTQPPRQEVQFRLRPAAKLCQKINKIMPTEFALHTQKIKCSAAHTKLTITSGPLMSCLETIYMAWSANVNLQFFLSDHFKGLMLFTNLHFPPLFKARLYDGGQLQWLLMRCHVVCFSSALNMRVAI